MRVQDIVGEPLRSLGLVRSSSARRDRVAEALADVHMPSSAMGLYPHQFSGGQRQRIAIARALVTEPSVLVADEPVSALDVTTRIEIIRLLKSIRADKGVSMVVVSHDLSLVAALCERVAVFRDGVLVEEGRTLEVVRAPQEAYTRALVAAIARLEA